MPKISSGSLRIAHFLGKSCGNPPETPPLADASQVGGQPDDRCKKFERDGDGRVGHPAPIRTAPVLREAVRHQSTPTSPQSCTVGTPKSAKVCKNRITRNLSNNFKALTCVSRWTFRRIRPHEGTKVRISKSANASACSSRMGMDVLGPSLQWSGVSPGHVGHPAPCRKPPNLRPRGTRRQQRYPRRPAQWPTQPNPIALELAAPICRIPGLSHWKSCLRGVARALLSFDVYLIYIQRKIYHLHICLSMEIVPETIREKRFRSAKAVFIRAVRCRNCPKCEASSAANHYWRHG